jgi:PAS domain S-box-containing protein
VTARRRAENALRTLARQWRTTFDAVADSVCLIDLEGTLLRCNAATAELLGRPLDDLTGHKCWELVHGTSEPHDDCPVVRMSKSRRRETLETQIGGHWLEITVDPVLDPEGEMVGAVHLISDITKRKQAEGALRSALAEADRGRQMLLALGQAAEAVQRARTSAEVHRTIGDELKRLDHRVVVFGLTPDREQLTATYLTVDPDRRQEAQETTGIGNQAFSFRIVPGGLHDRVISQGQTLFLDDVTDSMAEALPALDRPRVERLAAILDVERAIYAPLLVGEETAGVLLVTGADLTPADVPAVTAFANQASIALENAHLFAQVRAGRERLANLSRRLLDAQESERRHIARELHDEIGQALTVIKINLQAAQRSAVGEGVAYLNDSLRTVEGALQQVRGLSLDLRPSLLDDLGLAPALRWYLDRQARQAGFRARLSCNLQERLPPDVEIACFRLVQEALTNIMRHAAASKVQVELRRGAEDLQLLIRDDGQGFDPPDALDGAARGKSLGLLGMVERVQLLGGQLEIDSAPGQGTEIRVRFPQVPPAADADDREDSP